MPNTEGLKRRLEARIEASPHTVTVQYAPVAPRLIDTAPTVRPASPLSGAPATPTLLAAGATPSQPDVTGIRVLWTDTVSAVTLGGQVGDPRRVTPMGWVANAHVLLRVKATDIAAFTNAHAVIRESDAARYRVLQIDPMGASFGEPHSYAVWLAGAKTQ